MNVVGPWVVAWLGATVLGIGNGTLRQAVYERRLGERKAQYLATAILVNMLGGYMRVLQRRWPIRSIKVAAAVGAAWTALTVGFEFGFGHFVARQSWSKLLAQYDVVHGNPWFMVLLCTALGPIAVFEQT